MSTGPDRPGDCDHVVVLADDDPRRRDGIRAHLARVPGRRADVTGGRPRFRVLVAGTAEEAQALATPEVAACALAGGLALRDGSRLVKELRGRRPELAIVAFFPETGAGPGADELAALQADADRVVPSASGAEVASALETALDLRRLAVLVATSEAELAEARQRLARLAGPLAPAVGGLRPPATREAVVPFHQAAREYLLAAAELFAAEPRALAERLGISYFAMRRLLKRYEVPIPGRPRRNAHGPTAKR